MIHYIGANRAVKDSRYISTNSIKDSLEDFAFDNNNLFDKYFNSIEIIDKTHTKIQPKDKRQLKKEFICKLIQHMASIGKLNADEKQELITYYADIYEG